MCILDWEAVLSAICRYLNTAGEGSDLDQLDDHLRADADTVLANLR